MTQRTIDTRPDEPHYLEPVDIYQPAAPKTIAERVGKLLEPLAIKIPPYMVSALRDDILSLIADVEQQYTVERDSAQDSK